jgi:ribosomal protein L11 methylase PrmA
VIVSGIVDDDLQDVAAAYGRAGLTLAAQAVRRSWAAAVLVRDA